MKVQIAIEGMTCGHCSKRVENALKGLNGVTNVEVNLGAKNAVVELSDNMDEAILKETVEDAGYDVTGIKKI